jgi:hypothetical protein
MQRDRGTGTKSKCPGRFSRVEPDSRDNSGTKNVGPLKARRSNAYRAIGTTGTSGGQFESVPYPYRDNGTHSL